MVQQSPRRSASYLLAALIVLAGFPSAAAARPFRLDKSSVTGWYHWECKDGSDFGWSPDKGSAKDEARAACRAHGIVSKGVDLFVGAYRPAGAETLSQELLSGVDLAGEDTASDLSGGDGLTVGLVAPFRGDFALEVALSASEDRFRRNAPGAGGTVVEADVDRWAADLGVRFYPVAFGGARLWLYGGLRATALDPAAGTLTVDGRRQELPDGVLDEERAVEATVGGGADVALSDSLGLSIGGRWGPETGWGVTAGVSAFRLFRRDRYVYACHSERESGTCCRGFGCSWGNNDVTCRSADRHCAGPLDLTPI